MGALVEALARGSVGTRGRGGVGGIGGGGIVGGTIVGARSMVSSFDGGTTFGGSGMQHRQR